MRDRGIADVKEMQGAATNPNTRSVPIDSSNAHYHRNGRREWTGLSPWRPVTRHGVRRTSRPRARCDPVVLSDLSLTCHLESNVSRFGFAIESARLAQRTNASETRWPIELIRSPKMVAPQFLDLRVQPAQKIHELSDKLSRLSFSCCIGSPTTLVRQRYEVFG